MKEKIRQIHLESILWVCLLCGIFSGCGKQNSVYLEEAADDRLIEDTQLFEQPEEEQAEISDDCYVYICGEVVHPGVYRLDAGSRIYEAVEMAGGMTSDASIDGVNQAQTVTDGMMVKIPNKEEQAALLEKENRTGGTAAADGKLDLNTATGAELMTLPGIGETKAESILAYRQSKGGFSSVEEIMQVDGIKEGVYNRIKDSVTVR